MSSLAGALDGYTHQRHAKMHYNPISDDIEMTPSKNEPDAQDDDEEMDDLFGNDNDVEEQKRLRSVQNSEFDSYVIYVIYVILFPSSAFLEHLHRQLLPDLTLNVCLLPNENAGRLWNMKKKMHRPKFQ